MMLKVKTLIVSVWDLFVQSNFLNEFSKLLYWENLVYVYVSLFFVDRSITANLQYVLVRLNVQYFVLVQYCKYFFSWKTLQYQFTPFS